MLTLRSNHEPVSSAREILIRPCTAGSRTKRKNVYREFSGIRNVYSRLEDQNDHKLSDLKLTPRRKVQIRSILRNTYREHDKRPLSKEDIVRERYSLKATMPRPASAPHTLTTKHEISASTSATETKHVVPRTKVTEDMFEIVRAAKEAKTFKEDADFYHTIEKSIHEPEKDEHQKDAAPVFNKRLFASQGAVIITREARRLMSNNALANPNCALDAVLTKTEVQCLRCVVDGLKLIHKGQDFVKDVLSKVVTYELYKAFEYVPLKDWEDHLACYYILNGAVEVTYDLSATQSRNVYQANIIYSHGTGEYLGLVSPEDPTEDLAPPATIYTKELTQFIRVDRQRFHKLMQQAVKLVDKRKRDFIASHSFLVNVSEEVKEKIMHKLAIQDYPANKVLLAQGEIAEFLFIIISGRCQTYREVYIPEADKQVLFYLTGRDPDDFFGEECVLDNAQSVCTIVSATATTIMKLHRSALKMVQRDKLTLFIDELRHDTPSDENLRDRGYRDSLWNKFKHTQIKRTLKEDGKLKYLSRPESAMVRERPPDNNEMYTENMRRFVMKGSQFEPMRVRSADTCRSSKHYRNLRRPHTGGLITETHSSSSEDSADEHDSVDGKSDTSSLHENHDSLQTNLLTLEKAKSMKQRINKAMESKENLLKVLEDPGRLAWKAESALETNFMKNGVLVTMTSEDIVRKAKALADTNADKRNKSKNENEDWDTILHAENQQAKMLISANKLRIKDIKRRLADLQKKRERDRQKLRPGRAKYFSDDEDDDDDYEATDGKDSAQFDECIGMSAETKDNKADIGMSDMTEHNKLDIGMSDMTEHNKLDIGVSDMTEHNKLDIGMSDMTENNEHEEKFTLNDNMADTNANVHSGNIVTSHEESTVSQMVSELEFVVTKPRSLNLKDRNMHVHFEDIKGTDED